MPAIQITTNLILDDNIKKSILEKASQLITILSGKKPERTMMRIQDNIMMYFSNNYEPCIYIHLELYKPSSSEEKQEFVRKLFELLNEETGIPLERMYLTIAEYPDWGSEGKLRI